MRRTAVKGLVLLGALGLAACSADSLEIPNYNNATPDQVLNDPVAALPFLASGVMRDDRGNYPGFVQGMGILGREAYNYSPTEGRNTSGWLTNDVNNQASFGGTSNWTGYYTTLRDIANMASVVDNATTGLFTDAQVNATRGFVHTFEAMQLYYLISTRHNLGVPVEIKTDPTQLAPFVSRDSAFNYIAGRLAQAQTELSAGGTAFPFALHAGFAGFNTPSTFLQFVRGFAARVNATRASLGVSGCGAAKSAACYQQALTNLSGSFINATGSLSAGPTRVYSPASGDAANGLSNANNTTTVAHASIDAGVQSNAGVQDRRFTDKIRRMSSPVAPGNSTLGIATNWDHTLYPTNTSPMSIIRNEELILLRAEAKYFTGDAAGAAADLNIVRTAAGLAPYTTFANEAAFIDALLYERKWSLLFEGHRWVDMRRFGRLETLPKDMPDHIVAVQLPVPQAECLSRAGAEAALKGPGC